MRCLVLGALVLIASAGCGGPSGNPDLRDNNPGARKESPRSAAEEAAIQAYSAAFSAAAVETCVAAFDAGDGNLSEHAQVDKPSSGDLAAFLCSCLGASECL